MKAINVLRMRKAASSFTPITNTYNTSTSATETIPTGATMLVIELWGGGGAGGSASVSNDGGGGGSGGYVKKTFTLTSADWGKTFTYTIGPVVSAANGTDSTLANNTFATSTSLTAGGGVKGAGGVTGTQGAGGTASGGDVNTTGNGSGGVTSTGAGAPNGGGDQTANGNNGTAPGGGGGGGLTPSGLGGNGTAGRAKFSYT